MDRNRLLAAAPLLAASIWGGMCVVSKWGFRSIPPLTLAFLRIALSAGVLYIAVRATTPARSFDRGEWRRFATPAVWLTATLSTQFMGTNLTNASQGPLLAVLTPVFMLVLGATALGGHLTHRGSLGTVLATVRTLAVLLGQRDTAALAGGSVSNVVLLLFSSLCFAASSMFAKPLVRRYSALETATYVTILSVPLFDTLVPVGFHLDPATFGSISPSLPVMGAVPHLGLLNTVATWCCWYKGMEYADASAADVFFFAQPVVGILLEAVFLREPVGLELLGGDAVLAVEVLLVDMDWRGVVASAEPGASRCDDVR